MRFILTTLILLLPVLGWSQDRTMTIEDAIQLALENNFQLKQAENNVMLTEQGIRSAYGDFLPNLNASFGGNQDIGRQFVEETLSFEDITAYRVSGGFSTNVTIFNGFQNINNLRRSQVDHEQQKASTERIRENIIFDTAMRFLSLLLDKELLEIAEQTLETSRMQLEQVEAQVEVGARPIVDLYQQQSTVAMNELQVVQAENAVNLSRTRLIRILQIEPDPGLEFVVPDFDDADLMPQTLDLEEMILAALANRRDLHSLEYQIQSDRYTLDIAKANRYPSVSAGANLSTSYSDQFFGIIDPQTEEVGRIPFSEQFFDQRIGRGMGLSVSIPIFNRFNTSTNIQQAQIQYRNSQLQLDDIKFGIREDISQAYNDYQSLIKELEATERTVQAAERAFETQQQRYEIGATTLIELNQATTNYVQALSDRQSVKFNFIFQEKLLDYYIGRLEADLSF
jgi:outer membrane protein